MPKLRKRSVQTTPFLPAAAAGLCVLLGSSIGNAESDWPRDGFAYDNPATFEITDTTALTPPRPDLAGTRPNNTATRFTGLTVEAGE